MKPIHIGNIEITPGEILFSILMFIFFLIGGLFISEGILVHSNENAQKYISAIPIDNEPRLFKHSLSTNAGKCLLYGEFNAINPISVPELKNEFLAIQVFYENYIVDIHYKIVEDSNGNKKQVKVDNSRWEASVFQDTYFSNDLEFMGVTFPVTKFEYTFSSLLLNKDTVSTSCKYTNDHRYMYKRSISKYAPQNGDIRWRYSIVPKSFSSTVLADLNSNDIFNVDNPKNSIKVFNSTIEEVINHYKNIGSIYNIFFWIIYSIVIFVFILLFVNLRNKWLDNKNK